MKRNGRWVFLGLAVALTSGLSSGVALGGADPVRMHQELEAQAEQERLARLFPSPLTAVQGPEGLHGVALDLDLGVVELMREAGAFTLQGFILQGGREVDLELERFEVFAPHARRLTVDEHGEVIERIGAPDVALFRGTVVGEKTSTVFLALGEHGSNGFLDIDGVVHVLSSGAYGSGLPPVVYNLTDLPDGVIRWAQFVCGLEGLVQDQVAEIDDGGGVLLRDDGNCRLIDIAIDSDWVYTRDLFGSNPVAAEAYIATLMGAVSEIYSRDVNTGFQVVFSRTFGSNNSPYNSNDIYNALGMLQNVFLSELSGVDRHLAHLFSGRRYSGAAGVAYLSALCDTSIGYGVSGYLNGFFPYPLINNNSQNWDLIVVAHEIGHNLGTGHTHDSYTPVIDGCGNGNCAGASSGTIMSYCHTCPGGTANIRVEFHPRVRERINGYLNGVAASGRCGEGLDLVPPTVVQQPQDAEATIGFDASFTVSATGNGPLQYRWRHNGTTIAGATSPTLNIIAAQPSDAGVYDCVVTAPCGSTMTLPAVLTVTGTDCTGSGLDDAYEILMGIEEDCNGNGVPDRCDIVERTVYVASPRYEPLDRNSPKQLHFGPSNQAVSDLVVTAKARGRLGNNTQRIAVRVNGQLLGWLYENTGLDCAAAHSLDTIVIPASTFNAAFQGGDLTFDLVPTYNVTANCLTQTFFEVTVSYTQAAASTDSTGDGVPDECSEVQACSSADISGSGGDGIPDGFVNAFDLDYYVGLWLAGDPAADRTGPAGDGVPDGVVNAFDLDDYINAWLAGCD